VDEIIKELNIKKIDVIKLNIEGAEIEALEESKNALTLAEKILLQPITSEMVSLPFLM